MNAREGVAAMRSLVVKRILVIEDAADFQMIFKKTFEGDGYSLDVAGEGQTALDLLIGQGRRYDLILLDLSLPDMDGMDLFAQISELEATRTVPVMVVSGKQELQSKLSAFTIGAEDYVTKPFDPVELKARVEARLRKRSSQETSQQYFKRGPFNIDLTSQRVRANSGGKEIEIALTPKEYSLLLQLLKVEDKVLTRTELLSAVWGGQVNVHDRTVDVHVSSLRRKLGELGASLQAVPGKGYRYSPALKKAG